MSYPKKLVLSDTLLTPIDLIRSLSWLLHYKHDLTNMTACCQAVLSCQKLSWPFCAGQSSLLILKSFHLLPSKGTWRVQDIDTLGMCNLEKQGRCTASVLHPWLLQRRSECALLCIFRRTQALPLLSLAVLLECEITGEQLWSYVQRSFLLVCCSAFSFQFSSFWGCVGAGRTVHRQCCSTCCANGIQAIYLKLWAQAC